MGLYYLLKALNQMEKDKAIFSKINKKATHQIVEEQIRSAIFKNYYKPGDKIPTERELSSMFNASRSSIREALRSLEKSGLIIKKTGMHGGSFVNKIDSLPLINGFKDLYQLGQISQEEISQARLMFEPAVTFEAAKKAEKKDIELLKMIHKNREDTLLSGVAQNIHYSNFHVAIAEITGNRVYAIIMEVLTEMHASINSYIKMDMKAKKAIIDQHLAILKEIENHNPEMAGKKMRNHILYMKKEIARLEKNN